VTTDVQTSWRDAHWARVLSDDQLERVAAELVIRDYAGASVVCRKGERVDAWIGVLDGLLKISSVSAQGEGSLLKDEPRRYDAVALRDSTIATMPRGTFLWLLDTSIPFNRFLLTQLNERLGQFIATVEFDRLLDPEGRIARCLAGLFNPHLYPGAGPRLPISQEEIGYLSGVSRQRVNQALQVLERAGLLQVEYGAVRVLDVAGLSRYAG
jgi:CRP/FNR family transcriptional regulator, cyclic AMP receptor protein